MVTANPMQFLNQSIDDVIIECEQLLTPIKVLALEDNNNQQVLQQIKALKEALNIIQQQHISQKLNPTEVSEVGNYVIQLLHSLGHYSYHQEQSESATHLIHCSLPIALFISRQSGEINLLEPIVDTIAQYANKLTEPKDLETFSYLLAEIISAISPSIKADLDNSNPNRAWRILNLNYAIIGTRSHQPELMEIAFDYLIKGFANEVSDFFSQGMEQMELLNYPTQVREVMTRYYNEWSKLNTNTLH